MICLIKIKIEGVLSMKAKEFWFVVDSRFLYGPEVLETVEARAKEIAADRHRYGKIFQLFTDRTCNPSGGRAIM